MRLPRFLTMQFFLKSVIFSAVSIAITLCLIVPIFAQSESSLFKQANLYYENVDYQKALETYEKVLAKGEMSSADLFYNIGNCYFKLNDLGHAILNYKRASLLRPRDFFIQHNLTFARSLVDYTIEDTRSWYVQISDKWLSFFTDLEWVISVLFALGLVFASCICCMLFPQHVLFKTFRTFFILLFLVLSIVVLSNKYFSTDARSGVVVAHDVKAHSGPVSTENIVFRLAQGLEITIIEKRGAWYKIRLKNGSIGWVLAASIEPVYPHLFQSEVEFETN